MFESVCLSLSVCKFIYFSRVIIGIDHPNNLLHYFDENSSNDLLRGWKEIKIL